MQMPVDISEVLKIATDLKDVEQTPVSVAVLIDGGAPAKLASHVRSAFASEGANVRVTVAYLEDGAVEPRGGEDAAIIVAGKEALAGSEASLFRNAGIPAMIVADDAAQASLDAEQAGYPIPDGDVVSPVALDPRLPFLKKRNQEREEESPELDAATFKVLDERMGKWIVEACAEKKLAFALAFPFIRRPLALDSVTATSLQNAAIGFVPFLPGADMPIMTLNQVKMALQIATAYGQPLQADRVKELVVVVASAFACRSVVRAFTKVIPVAGWLFSGLMGFGATEALGRALMEYFEAGGDVVGVAQVVQTARDGAMSSAKKFAESDAGKAAMKAAKNAVTSVGTKQSQKKED